MRRRPLGRYAEPRTSRTLHPPIMHVALLFLFFVALPFIELILIIKAHRFFGGWLETLAVIIITGVVGAGLARAQGFRVWHDIQSTLRAGQLPARQLVEGVMILIAGALLITPGFLTDCGGFLLLIPACRRIIRTWLLLYFKNRLRDGRTRWSFHARWQSKKGKQFHSGDRINDDDVIDVMASEPDKDDPEGPHELR